MDDVIVLGIYCKCRVDTVIANDINIQEKESVSMNIGSFRELNSQELFVVNGGDKIKQEMINEAKKAGKTKTTPQQEAAAINYTVGYVSTVYAGLCCVLSINPLVGLAVAAIGWAVSSAAGQ